MSTSIHVVRPRPFVIADYSDGEITEIPQACPCQQPGEVCYVSLHHYRERATGPKHRLAVLSCHTHDYTFTAYPPGYRPYARRGLVDEPARYDAPALAEVVEEAAEGTLWARSAEGGTDRWWSTQVRLLTRGERLFGPEREAWRRAVAVSFGLALDAVEVASAARGVVARGRALRALLQGLSSEVLLRLGAMTGCWGRPWRWDRDRQVLVDLGGLDPPIVSTKTVRSPPGTPR